MLSSIVCLQKRSSINPILLLPEYDGPVMRTEPGGTGPGGGGMVHGAGASSATGTPGAIDGGGQMGYPLGEEAAAKQAKKRPPSRERPGLGEEKKKNKANPQK